MKSSFPDYKVVSEAEIKIRNADNGWDTYFWSLTSGVLV